MINWELSWKNICFDDLKTPNSDHTNEIIIIFLSEIYRDPTIMKRELILPVLNILYVNELQVPMLLHLYMLSMD